MGANYLADGRNLLSRGRPDEPPFVNVGDRIKVSQTVCIIEAMKLMNEIDADEVSGQVMEILVQNAEPVEYGQVLMRINPDWKITLLLWNKS